MHTVFHFFHSALLVLVFLVRGWLLWLHSAAQEINAGLLVHLSSAHPFRNDCAVAAHHQISSSDVDTQVRTPAAPHLLPSHLKQVDEGAEMERSWVISSLPPPATPRRRGSFLQLPNREKLGFHGVDYFSSQSLKDKAQGRRDCSPFRGATKGLLS